MVAGAAVAAALGASALGGCWSRSRQGGEGEGGEGHALPLAGRGRCWVSVAPGPARTLAWRPNQASVSLPKAHLLLFRGRGKSF